MISDGCTGFQWAERLFPIRQCCDVHDAGGGDFELVGCLLANTPVSVWPIVAGCAVLALLVGRPLLRLLKGRRNDR